MSSTELEEMRAELSKLRRDRTIGMILSWAGLFFGLLSLALRWLK